MRLDTLSAWIGLAAIGCNELQHAADSVLENLRLRDQAEDQISFCWKIVEMSRLHQNIRLTQQPDSEVLVRASNRGPQHGIPAAFDFKPLTQLLRRQLRIQF